jgi:peptidoglycan hydrolase-like amidase
MKRSAKSIVTATLATCLIGGSISAAHGANPVQVPAGFTITGSGFGHGAGMSQYGAQGMGLDGFTASQILTHYFTGTTVDAVTLTSPNIRVGILQDRKFIAIRGEVVPGAASGGAFNIVVDANAPIPVAPGAVATFTTSKGLTQVSTGSTVVSGKKIALNWTNAQTVMHVRHGKTAASAVKALGTASCVPNTCTARYRYGTLELASGAFDDAVVDLVVVNTLRLSDEYLYGLGEVPSSWTEAAMQAQAIAGRSYAVRKTATRSGCDCQIYSTTLDQAFVGYSKEIATMGDRWVAAVNATIVNPSVDPNTAYVVQHNGTTISTYYSSSTGGKSQPTNEVWGASRP